MSASDTYYLDLSCVASSRWAIPFQLEDGTSVSTWILVSQEAEAIDPLHDRLRPTGENGSGPYFSAYYHPPGGVLSYFDLGTRCRTSNAFLKSDYLNGFGNPAYQYGFASPRELYEFIWLGDGHTLKKEYYAYYIRYEGPIPVPPNFSGWFEGVCSGSAHGVCENASQAHEFAGSWLAEFRARPTVARSKGLMIIGQKNFPQHSNLNFTSIPYQLKERYNFECYEAFDEFFIGEYISLADNAYINAAENLPEATCNSIANVLEIASTIASFFKGYSGIGSIRDAWLGYRYAYGTTTMDINEYAELTTRLLTLANTPRFTVFGSAERYGITAHVQFDVDTASFLPDTAISFLRTYGFKFTAVNAWDMIPYSFIVDWFFHVGDILQKLEDYQQMYHLEISNAWCTFTTNYSGVSTYSRTPYHFRGSLPWMTFGGTSKKTIGKRVLDTVALFL